MKDYLEGVLTQQKQQAQAAVLPPLKAEMEKYLKMEFSDSNVVVIDWWKVHSGTFPLLSGIAKSIYCQPASSASSERAFSQAGLTMTDKRQKMKVETLEKLCFINQNYEQLEQFIDSWKTTSHEEAHAPNPLPETESEKEGDDDDGNDDNDDINSSFLGPSVPMFKTRLERKRDAAAADLDPGAGPSQPHDDPAASSTPKPKKAKATVTSVKGKGVGKKSKPKQPESQTDADGSESGSDVQEISD